MKFFYVLILVCVLIELVAYVVHQLRCATIRAIQLEDKLANAPESRAFDYTIHEQ